MHLLRKAFCIEGCRTPFCAYGESKGTRTAFDRCGTVLFATGIGRRGSSMKFIHLSDLHLGKTLGDFDLIDDQHYILEQVLDLIRREAAEAVLIPGDVYDRAVPSEAATRLLDWFLERLAEAGVQTFMISGNHDSDERLHYGSGLFEASRIFIAARYDGRLYRKTVTDAYGEIDVYLLPFVKASQVKHFRKDAEIASYDDAVREVLKDVDPDESRRKIIVAHQFVAGKSLDPALGGSEGAGVQTVGAVEKIGCDAFDLFDYAALGHIHAPQKVGREEVRYAGSPLKYSLAEVDNDKSVPVVTLREKGEVEMELLPLKPKRNVRRLKGPLEKLLDKRNVTDPEDFIYATLTDEKVVDDAMSILQQTYPNTVRLDYDNSHTQEVGQLDLTKITQDRSFRELVGEFYEKIYGCAITEEELTMMKHMAEEAGLDETD